MWMGTYYRQLLLKKLKFKLHGKNALEVGCHDGFLLSKIRAKKKIGIDIEPIKKYPKIEYIKADFLDYDFKGRAFDMVLSIEVMEHVKYPEKFMKKLNSLISKKGTALLSVPSKNMKIFPYIFDSYLNKRWGHQHRRGFSFKELKNILNKNVRNKNYKIIEWNCPFWRTFYIPLKLFWAIFPGITKKLLKLSINMDSKFRKGKNGFFFIVIY